MIFGMVPLAFALSRISARIEQAVIVGVIHPPADFGGGARGVYMDDLAQWIRQLGPKRPGCLPNDPVSKIHNIS